MSIVTVPVNQDAQDINGFRKVIDHDKSLVLFVKKLKEFDDEFCRLMVEGSDFTLRLEVRANKGEIHHVRLYQDDIERVDGSQKRVDNKNGKG